MVIPSEIRTRIITTLESENHQRVQAKTSPQDDQEQSRAKSNGCQEQNQGRRRKHSTIVVNRSELKISRVL